MKRDILVKNIEKAPVSSKQSEGWDPCKEVKEDTGQGAEELTAKNSNTSHQSQPTNTAVVAVKRENKMQLVTCGMEC